MEEMIIEVDSGTEHRLDNPPSHRVHFYESSLKHTETGEPLVSISCQRHGTRMTITQAEDLVEWLSDWIRETKQQTRRLHEDRSD